MRVILLNLAAAVAVLAAAAPAQAQGGGAPPFELVPPIPPADLPNYCVDENRVYSLGAGLCLGRTGYTCVPPTGPTTGNRAFWTGKDDQVFTRPQCP